MRRIGGRAGAPDLAGCCLCYTGTRSLTESVTENP
jgi:hypothetical protein